MAECTKCGRELLGDYDALCGDCAGEHIDPTLFAGGRAEISDDEAY